MISAMVVTGAACALAAAVFMWMMYRPCMKEWRRLDIDYKNSIARYRTLSAEAGELESRAAKVEEALKQEHELRKIVTINRDKFKEDYERVAGIVQAVRPSWLKITLDKMKRSR